MKKQLTIIAIAAFTFFSCGNGAQNQNNANGTDTTVETPQCDVSTTTPRVELTPELLTTILVDATECDEIGTMFEPETNGNVIECHDYGSGIVYKAVAYRLDDTSFKIFYTFDKYSTNFSDNEYWYSIKAFDYKDGKLTESTLPPDLNNDLGTSTSFSGDTLKIIDDENDKSTIFVWNGTQMEKK